MTNTADLLEQIPDLGEDVQDPEDCFTEGIALGGSLPQSQLCLDGQEDQQLLGTQGLVAPHPDPAACPPSRPHSLGLCGLLHHDLSHGESAPGAGPGSCRSAALRTSDPALVGWQHDCMSHSSRAWV